MNAELRSVKNAAEQQLAAEGDGRPRRAGCRATAAWGARSRVRAFRRAGLPHRRVEEWKYTDLRALMRDAKPLAGPPDAAAKARAKDAGARR